MPLSFDIHFAPLISTPWLIAVLIVAALLSLISARTNLQSALLRAFSILFFIAILLNPSFVQSERVKIKDVVAVIADKSLSQSVGARLPHTEKALTDLRQAFKENPDFELRTVEYTGTDDTALFKALDELLADVPQSRRAGAVFLTDGQVHDAPAVEKTNDDYGPLHVFLSGDKNEKDRQIAITQSPAYAIVGKPAQIKYKIADSAAIKQTSARVSVKSAGLEPVVLDVPINEEQTFDVPIDHAGKNIFEFEVESVEGEITEGNNRAVLEISGLRDRMRVLLVTGQPYAGGRTWRDLLKSDPNIDLVQFTILREPEKLDSTPQEEMALIAFPFRELFEVKLREFDLVIFDRYKLNRILPENYFDNIKAYIEEGGALLDINGPGYAGEESLYNTVLRDILPGKPTGRILNAPFLPQLTPEGKIHPVTRPLNASSWGHWLRQTEVEAADGDVLMSGTGNTPLLILKRVQQGRLAQLSSDQIWLWSRNYDGGGPYAELVKRLIHWLMKEPELDETLLNIGTDGLSITLQSISHEQEASQITMKAPDQSERPVQLQPQPDGSFKTSIEVEIPGVYSFKRPGGVEQFAFVGDFDAPELNALLTTPEKLSSFAEMSGGHIEWMAETPHPAIKKFRGQTRFYGGNGVFGFRDHGNYEVRNFREISFFKPWMGLAVIAAVCVLSWWREGRSKE